MRLHLYILIMCILPLLPVGCAKHTDSDATAIVKSDTIDSRQIIRLLSEGQDVSLKDKHIVGKLDFCSVEGDSDFETTYIHNAICLVGCTFEDSVSAARKHGERYCVFDKKVIFNCCEFRQGVDFSNAEFRDKLRADMSRFGGTAVFSGTVFSNNADFSSANFMDDAVFVGCTFTQKAGFRKSFFKRGAVFQQTRFETGANFELSYFYGYTEFSNINAYFAANFSDCKFIGGTLFLNSMFLRDLNFARCSVSPQFEFRKNRITGQLIKDDTLKIDFNN